MMNEHSIKTKDFSIELPTIIGKIEKMADFLGSFEMNGLKINKKGGDGSEKNS